MELTIANAIVDALSGYGYEFDIDQYDAVFLSDAINDIATIYYESKRKSKKDYEEDEENRREDEAMEEYYEKKGTDEDNKLN